MYLTKYEQEMAQGKYGPGLQKAINILIRYGKACGAERLVEITSAHVMPKEPPELLSQFTEGIEELPVTTTTHPLMSAFNPEKWEAMGIPADFAAAELAEHEERQKIHGDLGFIKCYSCLPMHLGNLPQKGDYISWIGSCAQILGNSLIGAKTNKDGTIVNLCSALTGRALYHGLLLDENRYAKVVIKLAEDIRLETDDDYGALGYYVGGHVIIGNVVFDGIPKSATFDQLKYLIAPVATSGSVHICHVTGITPEAPTVEAALGGKEPEDIVIVTRQDLEKTKNIFRYDPDQPVDLVIIGCPHVTVQEARRIAKILKDKKIAEGKRLWLGLSDATCTIVRAMGDAGIIEEAGGVFSNTCQATIPDSPLPENVQVVMTNSFKGAHYINSLQQGKVRVMISSLEECLKALNLQEAQVK
ncbi:MAG: aconitase X catalytic domain-containing protein [Clostridia bacterium]|nr:aconitase X catalytic domain-containing protein [Clostridia bacterium]